MQAYLKGWCDQLGFEWEEDKKGNLYVTPSESRIAKAKAAGHVIKEHNPVWVAHLDTVFPIQKRDPLIVRCGEKLFGRGEDGKMTGLGADDKCGIYAALHLMYSVPGSRSAFFVDEEIGCQGSKEANLEFFKGASCALQADRRGHGCAVAKYGSTDMASKEFRDKANSLMKTHGYKTVDSYSVTDVKALVEKGVGISCLNFECGYYDPHCPTEYINLKEFESCLKAMNAVGRGLEDKQYLHEYKAYVWEPTTRGGYDFSKHAPVEPSRYSNPLIWDVAFRCNQKDIANLEEFAIGDSYYIKGIRHFWDGLDWVEASFMEQDNHVVYCTEWLESIGHFPECMQNKLLTEEFYYFSEYREMYNKIYGKGRENSPKPAEKLTPRDLSNAWWEEGPEFVYAWWKRLNSIAAPPKKRGGGDKYDKAASLSKKAGMKSVKATVYAGFDKDTLDRYHAVNCITTQQKPHFVCKDCGDGVCPECNFCWAAVTEALIRKCAREGINLQVEPQGQRGHRRLACS